MFFGDPERRIRMIIALVGYAVLVFASVTLVTFAKDVDFVGFLLGRLI